MSDLKSRASCELNHAYPVDEPPKRWTRHGSTRYLFDEISVVRAIAYVLEGQGIAMAIHDGRTNAAPLEPEPRTE